MVGSSAARKGLVLVAAIVALGVAPMANAKVGQPRTAGPSYDRNASVVQSGAFTYLFFARSQAPCNRLELGAPCPDNIPYDMYFKVSADGGKTYGPDHLAAKNLFFGTFFYGRTIAAVESVEGTGAQPVLYAFWASGGDQNTLYYVRAVPSGDATVFDAPRPVAAMPPDVFNVEALSDGGSIYLYTEEFGSIYARRYAFDGTDLALGAGPTLVAADKNIPKGIVDNQPGRTRFKLTFVDASAYPTVDVYVSQSPDGLAWQQPPLLVVHENCIGNWDPQLAELPNGRYYLHFAPDQSFTQTTSGCADSTGHDASRQRIALTTSNDFVRWSATRDVSPAFKAGVSYWDYWPEAFVLGNKLTLYYTSERGFDDTPDGVGHIWTVPGDGGLDVNQAPNGSFETSTNGVTPDRWSPTGSASWVAGGTDGKHAVSVGPLGSWVSDPIPVTPGSTWGALADAGGAGGRIVVEQLGAAGAPIATLTQVLPISTTVPTALGDAVTVGDAVTAIRIRLEGGFTGTTTFDDVRVFQE